MAEPMDEAVETSWLEWLNRYDSEIWPALFEPRGISRADGMILWSLNMLRTTVCELKDALVEPDN